MSYQNRPCLLFRAKEEEITKKKMEVKERVQAQLSRVEQETKKLAEIRNVSIWIFLKTEVVGLV